MLVMLLARVCTSSTILRRDSIIAILPSVSPHAAQQVFDLGAQLGDIVAVLADELQIGLAAAADLTDVLHLGLHRLHQRLALGQRLDLVLHRSRRRGPDRSGALRSAAIFFSVCNSCVRALLELLDHASRRA